MKNTRNIIIAIIIAIIIIVSVIGVIAYKNINDKSYELEKVEKYSYFKLYKNQKYGVIDEKGNIVIEAIYDELNIPNPSKPLFVCYSDYNETTGEYKTKVLNEKNEKILTNYEQVLPLMNEESTSNIPFEKTVLKYRENGKYGIIDFNGKIITKPIYEEIESLEYREGALKVRQNGKYGVINIKGKQIVKPQYDQIESDSYYTEGKDYMEAGFIVQIKTDEGYRYGYINKEGKEILQTNYNEINRITDIKDNEKVYLLVSRNGKNGILENKKILIPYEYEEIEYNKINKLFIVQKDGKQGVISIEGKDILEAKYDYILCTQNKITTKKDEIIQIYDKNGEKKQSNYENTIETSNENYIITIDNEEKFGVINKEGQVIIKNKYEYIEYAFENYFIITENGKVGVIDINNGLGIDFKYDIIQKVKDKNALQAIISSKNTIEIYNNKLEKQTSIKEAILYTYDNYIKLISASDMKYLDNNGNIISNKEVLKENKVYAYSKNGKWGFINDSDKTIVEPTYDMVTEFNQYGYAGIKKDNKWGVVNKQGEIVLEPSYKIDFNEPDFIGKYCRLNFGYGFEYYTDELVK